MKIIAVTSRVLSRAHLLWAILAISISLCSLDAVAKSTAHVEDFDSPISSNESERNLENLTPPDTFFWVGGAGNWSDHNAHWATTSGGAVFHNQVPSSVNPVVFDANSFSSAGTVTLNVQGFCKDMIWRSGVEPDAVFSSNNLDLDVDGDLTILADSIKFMLTNVELPIGGDFIVQSELFTYTHTGGDLNVTGDLRFEQSTINWNKGQGSADFIVGGDFIADTLSGAFIVSSQFDIMGNMVIDSSDFDFIKSGGATTVFGDVTIVNSPMDWNSAAECFFGGSLTLSDSMDWNQSGTVTFNATSTGHNIDPAGQIFDHKVVFDGAGGEWTMLDRLLVGSGNLTIMTTGSLLFNGFSPDLGKEFWADNTNVINLDFTGCDSVSVVNRFVVSDHANTTFHIDDATLIFRSALNFNSELKGGGRTYANIDVHMTSNITTLGFIISDHGNDINDLNVTFKRGLQVNIQDSATFNNVSFHTLTAPNIVQPHYQIGNSCSFNEFEITGPLGSNWRPRLTLSKSNSFNVLSLPAGSELILSAADTQTVASALNLPGTQCRRISISGGTISSAAATVNTEFLLLENTAATGGATFNAPNSVDLGNVSGWTVTSTAGANDLYWIGDGGDFFDPLHWSFTSGGAPSGCVPGSYNNVFFDANSFSMSGQSVTITGQVEVDTMLWDGVTNFPTLAASNLQLTVNGDLRINAPMDFDNVGNLILLGSLELHNGMPDFDLLGQLFLRAKTTGHTIDLDGHVIENHVTFEAPGGEYTLLNEFNMHPSFGVLFKDGNFISNGYNVDWGVRFDGDNGAVKLLDFTGTDTIAVGIEWRISFFGNSVLNIGTATIVMTHVDGGLTQFVGGNKIYHSLVINQLDTTIQTTSSSRRVDFYTPGTFNSDIILNLNYQTDVNFRNNFSSTGDIIVNYLTGKTGLNTNIQFIGSSSCDHLRVHNQTPALNTLKFNNFSTINVLDLDSGSSVEIGASRTVSITDSLILIGECDRLMSIKGLNTFSTINMGSAPVDNVLADFVILESHNIIGDNAPFNVTNSTDNGNVTGWMLNNSTPITYYWIGGNGNWHDATHWSYTSGGAPQLCIPNFNDHVIFDNNSFVTSNDSVTVDQNAEVKTLTWMGTTGVGLLRVLNNLTIDSTAIFADDMITEVAADLEIGEDLNIAVASTWFGNGTVRLRKSFSIAALTNWNFAGILEFTATSTGQTIQMSGQQFDGNVRFDGVGGEWTLLSPFDMHPSGQCEVMAGYIDFNGYGLDVDFGRGLDVAVGGTKTLDFTDVFSINLSENWNIGNATLIIDDAGIYMYGTAAKTFSGGNQTYNDVFITDPSSTSNSLVLFDGASTNIGNICFDFAGHNDVRFNNSASVIGDVSVDWAFDTLASPGFHISGTGNTFGDIILTVDSMGLVKPQIEFSGNTTLGVLSSPIGSSFHINGLRTINVDSIYTESDCSAPASFSGTDSTNSIFNTTMGSLNLDYVTLANHTITNGTYIGTNATEIGTVFGWNSTPPPPRTFYWIGDGGSTNDFAHWSTTSGGPPLGCELPSADDHVVFDENSFSMANQVVEQHTESYKSVTWRNISSSIYPKYSINGNDLVIEENFIVDSASLQLDYRNGDFDINQDLIVTNSDAFVFIVVQNQLLVKRDWLVTNSDFHFKAATNVFVEGDMIYSNVSGTFDRSTNPQLYISGDLIFNNSTTNWTYTSTWVGGNLKLDANLTNFTNNALGLTATDAGNTVDLAGRVLNGDLIFSGVGGEWTLLSDIESNRIFFRNGSMISNGFDITGTRDIIADGSAVMHMDFTGTEFLKASQNFIFSNTTGLTYDIGTAKVVMTTSSFNINISAGGGTLGDIEINQNSSNPANTITFSASPGNTYGNVDISMNGKKNIFINGDNNFGIFTATYDYNNPTELPQFNVTGSNNFAGLQLEGLGTQGPLATFDQANTFNNLIVTGRGTRLVLPAGLTQTVFDNFIVLGVGSFPILFNSSIDGTQATVSKPDGEVCMDYVRLKDIAATGGATFNAGASSLDLGNNSNWLFASCSGYYWIGGSGDWSDLSHWATSSGGTTNQIALPGPTDDVFFDASSFSAPGAIVTVDTTTTCRSMLWLSALFTPTMTNSVDSNLNIHGAFILTPNMIYNVDAELHLKAAADTFQVFSAGHQIDDIFFEGSGPWQAGSWILSSDLDNIGSIFFDQGRLLTDGYKVTSANFAVRTAQMRDLQLSSSLVEIKDGNWDVQDATGLTLDAGSSEIRMLSDGGTTTFSGGGVQYNNLSLKTNTTATHTIQNSNTINQLNIDNNVIAELEEGKTQNIDNLIANGQCGATQTIKSTTNGLQATISKASDTTRIRFTDLQDINATGGAVFIAGQGQDLGNNTGWTISVFTPPTITMDSMDATPPAHDDGTATANVIGSAPFTYLWNNGGTTQTITNLTPGTYYVTATDSDMCEAIDSISVIECTDTDGDFDCDATDPDDDNDGCLDGSDPQPLIASGIVEIYGNDSLIANGDMTPRPEDGTDYGAIGVNFSSSKYFIIRNVGPNNMTLTGPTPVSITGSTNFTITAQPNALVIAPGAADSFEVTYNPNLPQTDNATLTIASDDCVTPAYSFDVEGQGIACPIITATAAGTDETCPGNGSITVDVPVIGTPPFMYSIDAGATYQTSNIFSNLDDGMYTVRIKDAQACVSNDFPVTIGAAMDTDAPTALCQDITVYLDESGMVEVDSNAIDNSSTDNCTVDSFALSTRMFTCADTGSNAVTMTVFDQDRNMASCGANIIVLDTIPPETLCMNITVYLDENGQVVLDSNAIDAGSADNCMIDSFSLSAQNFFCSDTGVNSVTMTVVDVSGNSASCMAQVTVRDTTPPMVLCQDITAYLDENGVVSLDSNAIDNGSDDNCAIDSLTLIPSSFTCADTGAQSVMLIVVDVHGNSDTCLATVTVRDTLPPVAQCQNVTVYLDVNGMGAISPDSVNNGSSDNCTADAALSLSLDRTDFNCYDVGGVQGTPPITELFFSEYVHGSSNNKCLEIYNGTGATVDMSGYTLRRYANGTGTPTNIPLTGMLTHGDVFVICNTNAAAPFAGQEDQESGNVTHNGDDAYDLFNGTEVVDIFGTIGEDPGSQWFVNGISTLNHTLVRKPNVYGGTTANAPAFPTLGTEWIQFDNDFADSLGAHSVITMVASPTHTVTLNVEDGSGNTSTCTAEVTVLDTISPQLVCQDVTVDIASDGTYMLTAEDIDNGSSDNCDSIALSIPDTVFDCDDVGMTVVIPLTAMDAYGNTSTCMVNVTVRDDSSHCCDIDLVTVQATDEGCPNANDGSIMASANCSNCGPILYTIEPDPNSVGAQSSGLFSNLPDGMYEVKAYDSLDISCIDSSMVSVAPGVDTMPPLAVCKDITVYLDDLGLATLDSNAVENGSTDNCGVDSLMVNPNSFTCADTGTHTVVMTVTDINGGSHTCSSMVTVLDTISPDALCRSTTVYLDNNGMASLPVDSVDAGSSDNCGFSLTVSPSTFTCSNVGMQTVVLTATDASGNTSTCSTLITVSDMTSPTAVCRPATVYLDNNGMASLPIDSVDAGSSDNCDIVSRTISQSTFTCSDAGTQTVVLTVTDGSGNTSTCSSMITVSDTTSPIASCKNAIIYLDENGMASLDSNAIDDGSTDNCGIAEFTISMSTFTCADTGAHTVVMTVTDVNGATDTCSSVVTVLDTISPNALCRTTTVYLDNNGMASLPVDSVDAGSSDNCGFSLTVSPSTFTCSNVGMQTVVLTATDASGNTSTCSTMITVSDTTSPTAVCSPATVYLDNNGMASLPIDSVDAGSSDNCDIVSRTISQSTFTCSDVGTQTVVLTVTDGSGNTSTCSSMITVSDTTSPMASCKNAIIYLDENGMASLDSNALDDGSSDNCGIDEITTSMSTFTCADTGAHTVVMTVTDINGNSATCSSVVTVLDTIGPDAQCRPTTLYLDDDGMASLSADSVDNGSSDFCGIDSIWLSQTDFDCGDSGENDIWLYVTDLHGNIDSCLSMVTVVDTIDPNVVCRNINVSLNSNGTAMVPASFLAVSNSLIDCDGTQLTVSFSPTDMDSTIALIDCSYANGSFNDVTIYVYDQAGNVGSCVAGLHIDDVHAPNMVCDSTTIDIGNATVYEISGVDSANLIATLTDNCLENLMVEFQPSALTCMMIGSDVEVMVNLIENGNVVSSCISLVSVQGSIADVHVLHLDESATGNKTGVDWPNAFTSLDALNDMTCFTGLDTLKIAEGTYSFNTSDRNISLHLDDSLVVIGGFVSGGSTHDPINFISTISGNYGSPGLATDNAYHVVYIEPTAAFVQMHHLVIADGYADGLGVHSRGGGLQCEGIGILKNVNIVNSHAEGEGAGVNVSNTGKLTIEGNSTIENNTSPMGSIFYVDNAGELSLLPTVDIKN